MAFSSVFRDPLKAVAYIGLAFGALLGYVVGANGVSVSFGSVVGSRSLSRRKAYILACLCESLGGLLLGSQMADQRGDLFNKAASNETARAAIEYGENSVLAISGAFVLLGTSLSLPVSVTNALLGSNIGFSYVVGGMNEIRWNDLLPHVLAGLLLPCFSAIVAALLFFVIDQRILRRQNSLRAGLGLLPGLAFLSISTICWGILFEGSRALNMDFFPWHAALGITAAVGLLALLAFKYLQRPRKAFHVSEPTHVELVAISPLRPALTPAGFGDHDSHGDHQVHWRIRTRSETSLLSHSTKEDPRLKSIFQPLQVTLACFISYIHGGIMMGNMLAPTWTLLSACGKGLPDSSNWVFLVYSLGIIGGLLSMGHLTFKTMEEKIMRISPASSLAVEFGTAAGLILAMQSGNAVSSTQIKVASMVSVALIQSRKTIRRDTLGKLLIIWLMTVPVTALLTAGTLQLLLWAQEQPSLLNFSFLLPV